MLIVCAKSAAVLVLGGALLSQQPSDVNQRNENQDAAPPAPTIPAPSDDNADREQVEEQSQTQPARNEQRDQATNRRPAEQPQADRSIQQRQTYQSDDRIEQRENVDQARNDRQLDQQGRMALGVTLTDDLRVMQVAPGSPAEQMGLQPGDEILSMNGRTFNSIDAFIDTVGSTPQDQEIQIEIDRDGQRMTQAGQLVAWDRVHYSGTRMAGMGLQHQGYSSQGLQTHSAMRYPAEGGAFQGAPAPVGIVDAGFCCDPCAGFGVGYGYGYGYGGWDDGWSRREARRAARRGYYW